MPVPKRPKCRLAGTQTSCVPANTAGPAVGVACDARARKDRSASLQGRKGVAANTAGPVVGEACDVRKTWLYSPNNFAQ